MQFNFILRFDENNDHTQKKNRNCEFAADAYGDMQKHLFAIHYILCARIFRSCSHGERAQRILATHSNIFFFIRRITSTPYTRNGTDQDETRNKTLIAKLTHYSTMATINLLSEFVGF